MVTIKLLVWILVIVGFVLADWIQITKKHSRPFYLLENILKGIAFILYGAYIWNAQNELFTVVLILWCVTSYWLLFDLAMGLLLHGDPLYVGRNSGWIDRFHYVNDWTKIAYWIVKFMAVFTLIGTTINIYRHG